MPNSEKSGGSPCYFKRGDRWFAAYAHQRKGKKTYLTPRAGAKFFPFYLDTDSIRMI